MSHGVVEHLVRKASRISLLPRWLIPQCGRALLGGVDYKQAPSRGNCRRVQGHLLAFKKVRAFVYAADSLHAVMSLEPVLF